MCDGDIRIWFVAAVRRASSQPTLHFAPRGAQFIDQLREPIRFQVNLDQELLPRVVIPLDVSSAHAGDESLDVAQRQPEFMRRSRQDLVG
jgi:hypothetical protein